MEVEVSLRIPGDTVVRREHLGSQSIDVEADGAADGHEEPRFGAAVK
jgi:hypothetical protein